MVKKRPEFFALRYASDEAFEGPREWLRRNGPSVFDPSQEWPFLKKGAERVQLPISVLYQHLARNKIGLFDFCSPGSSVLRVLRNDFLLRLSEFEFEKHFNIGRFFTVEGAVSPDWVWFFPKPKARVRDLEDVARVIEAGLPFAMSSKYFLIVREDVYKNLTRVRIAYGKWYELQNPVNWVLRGPNL